MIPAAAQDVLDFWFADAASGEEQALRNAFGRWFAGGAAFDERIRERFGPLIETALAGGLSDWEPAIHARLALVIVLDQFPRNVYRRTARAFAGDARALALARDAVAEGVHRQLAPVERLFLLMPYQHAEDLEVQREGVALFASLAREPVAPSLSQLLHSSLEYAERHLDIVARFGRFPYRNDVLGRETTADERRWLAQTEERFGQ